MTATMAMGIASNIARGTAPTIMTAMMRDVLDSATINTSGGNRSARVVNIGDTNATSIGAGLGIEIGMMKTDQQPNEPDIIACVGEAGGNRPSGAAAQLN